MKILNDIACNLNWILNIKFENSIQFNSKIQIQIQMNSYLNSQLNWICEI
jgi:hypothetical protein